MQFLNTYMKIIHAEMDAYELPSTPHTLYAPIHYFLELGGKRLRPILALLGYRLFHDNVTAAVPIARMVELFHNFSLVHDDIMDQAPLRRGKATVHEKWNTNIAILSGDMILIKAYQELEHIDPSYQAELLKVFNACAVKVCEGQQYDMDFETHTNVSVEEYINMIYLKTSALVEHSFEMGAVLGGANENQRKHIRAFGKNLGIAFQLRDDLLDVFGEEDFGKRKAGDIISNKKTFLLLKAFEKANEKQTEQLHHWVGLADFDHEEKVKNITHIFHELEIRLETEKIIESYNQKASDALTLMEDVDGGVVYELQQLQEYLMSRTT